ncbi:MAG: AMP-binding protein [Anaerolineae bacterium]|nr:AMP-binding protein [Anaerolineae bacterium]
MAGSELISYGRRTTLLAAEHPDKIAIIFVAESGEEHPITWRELEFRSNQIAHFLAGHGIGPRTLLVIGLPNSPEHIYATLAGWKLGSLVLPLRAALPVWERDRVLEVGQPTLIIADWQDVEFPLLTRADLVASAHFPTTPPPDHIPHPGRAIASGGSTGRPKIIVDPRLWATRPGENYFGYGAGYAPGQTQLLAGPLYHNSPHGWAFSGLFDDQLLIVMERFNESRVVDLIERHHVNFMFMSPTMMGRVARLPAVTHRDFSSLAAIYHTSAPCPPWIKRFWIDLIGAEKIYEGYGSTEGIGAARIRGDEWLLHPGSVGRPHNTLLKILDPHGQPLPSGEVGEIYVRRLHDNPTYEYIGSPPLPRTPDGYASVGDLGWLDEDGYLYIADRRTDMIVSGGANIYPAEVEAALSEHPEVADLVVVGIPHDDWGRSVHAIIQPRDPLHPPDVSELNRYARERLASYKIPKSYEFLRVLPRNQMGKIRRTELTAEREKPDSYDIRWVNK